MGKKTQIKAISDGIDFQPLPTSDRAPIVKSCGSASDLPVVVAARRLKQQRRRRVLKLGLISVLTVALVVATVALLVFKTQEEELQEIELTGVDMDSMKAAPRQGPYLEPETDWWKDLEANKDLDRLAQSGAEIGMKLFQQEMEKSGNILFSPFSIQTALSMVTMGSRGSTFEQLMNLMSKTKSGLGVSLIEGDYDLKTMFGAAIPAFQSNDNFTIQTANAIFLQKDYTILDDMASDLKDYFQTSITLTDYNKPQNAADLINGWVEEKTMKKIHNLIEPSMLGGDTKMVLCNALYFKGMWADCFDKDATRKGNFYVSDKETVEAEFMHQRKELNIGTYKGYTVVGLPYSGQRFTMYLIAPYVYGNPNMSDSFYAGQTNEITPVRLITLESDLLNDAQGLIKALSINSFHPVKVDLLMPKFKIEATMELKENLKKLGVTAPFSAVEADLSGISGDRDLFLSDAIHKAFLEVNEEGSEAAAATGMISMTRMMVLEPPNLHFDRPFLFFIKDELTGLLLFQGRLADPTK